LIVTRMLLVGALVCAAAFAAPTPARAQEQDQGEGTEQTDEERRRERLRRWRGGQGNRGGEWGSQASEFLKKELDLDDEQAKKVGKIFQDAMGDMMKRMADSWGNEDGPNPENMRGVMEDLRLELSGKVREVLNDAQAREFDALVDQFDQRAQRWEQSARGWQDPTLIFEPAPISKRILLEKAERALFLGPDETAVVMPMVEDVLNRRIATAESKVTRRKDLRNAVDGGADPKEVVDRLQEIRAREEVQAQELIAAQDRLREVLTLEQEVRFVAMGILD
jgi:hypothetical protein